MSCAHAAAALRTMCSCTTACSSELPIGSGLCARPHAIARLALVTMRSGPYSARMQGIPWDRLPIRREEYRQQRIAQYNNYANVTVELRQQYPTLAEFQKKGVLASMRTYT